MAGGGALCCGLAAQAAAPIPRPPRPAPPPPAPPPGAAPYTPALWPAAADFAPRARQSLRAPRDPSRPFLVYAIGSSFTNGLGLGRVAFEQLRAACPGAPPLVWRQTVGNATPWQYLRGWLEGDVIPANPDLVLIYTVGMMHHLDDILAQLRKRTTAEVVVPTVHWRANDASHWGQREDAPDQDVAALRATCAKHGAFVLEHRAELARYMRENNLPIDALLRDKFHQSRYGTHILQLLFAAALAAPTSGAVDPRVEIHALNRSLTPGAPLALTVRGGRFDLGLDAGAGRLRVQIDDQPAPAHRAAVLGPVRFSPANAAIPGATPRETGPHGVRPGPAGLHGPDQWTLTVLDPPTRYLFEAAGAGPQGEGLIAEDSASADGQLLVPARWWRYPERSRPGDTYQISVQRGVVDEVSAALDPQAARHLGGYVEHRLAVGLSPGAHRLVLQAEGAPVHLRQLYAHTVQA
ncbi:MAG: SGNH/GDSL hydrolase family protein [Deltaproteobacteria bacterium]|nr:SGNH/GDSL hydrolase family protein [Deltaproteobacteria bacterium]